MRAYTGCHWRNGRWTHTWSDGTLLPAYKGRDDTDDKGGDGKGGGDGGAGGAGDDEGEDDDDDDDDVDTSQIKDPVAKARADAEAEARHKWKKRMAKALEEERNRIKAEQDLANKSEAEKEKARADAAEKRAQDLEVNLERAAYKISWQEAAAGRFDDNEVAMAFARKLPEWEDVEKDEDDPTIIRGLDKVADALAKARPALLKKEGTEEREDRSSGRPMNGPKKTKKDLKDEELRKKYPALRR